MRRGLPRILIQHLDGVSGQPGGGGTATQHGALDVVTNEATKIQTHKRFKTSHAIYLTFQSGLSSAHVV